MTKRNYGIDLLRIISMIMITAMHVVRPGMGSYAFENGNLALKTIYALCSSGVNCFLLISGYVYLNAKHRYSKLVQIIAEALFYNLLLTIGVSVLNNTLTFSRIAKCFLILDGSNWWFLRTYIGLFLFMPVVTYAVRELPKKDITVIITALILFFSIYGTLSGGDSLYLGTGFSVLWFVIVFAIGAFLKRIENNLHIRFELSLVLALCCTILAVGSIHIIDKLNMVVYPSYIDHHLFYAYNSPLMLGEAVFMLIAFKSLAINKTIIQKAITHITPSVFAVYLIQCQYYIYNFYFPNAFDWLLKYNNRQLIIIPLVAVSIFVICILIDQVRMALKKITNIDDLYRKIDKYFF